MKPFKLLVLLTALLAAPVLAHDSQSAGNVNVTFSTDADDALRSGAPTQVLFSFEHTGQQLSGQPLTACRCRALLYRGAPSARVGPLQDVMLKLGASGEARAVFEGVPAGDYTLVLDGRPQQFGAFGAFRMRYALSAKPN
jgi:hypothetical protein